MNVNDIPDDPTSCANPSYECGPLPDEQTGCVSGTGSICSNHLNLPLFILRHLSLVGWADTISSTTNTTTITTTTIMCNAQQLKSVFSFRENFHYISEMRELLL